MSSDLQIGLSGLLAAQRAMLVTAHNISNANTKVTPDNQPLWPPGHLSLPMRVQSDKG